MYRLSLILISLAIGLSPSQSNAAALPLDKPRPTVLEVAHLPKINQPRLSDSGDWFAAIGAHDGNTMLMIKNLEDDSLKPLLIRQQQWHFNWFRWLVDDRLITSVSIPRESRGTPYTVTRLILINPANGSIRQMFKGNTGPGNQQIQDKVVSLTPKDPNSILVSMNMQHADKPQIYRANLKRASKTRGAIQTHINGVQDWQADLNGNVRVGTGFSRNQKDPILKIKDSHNKWQDFSAFANQAGFEIAALPTHDTNLLYVISDHELPLGALYEFDISAGTFGRKLAASDKSAIAGISLNHNGDAIETIYFESELEPNRHLDPWLSKFTKQIDKLLPETANRIISIPPNHKRAIIYAFKSNIEPHYYLYERDTNSIRYLQSQYPTLAQRSLAKTVLTSYKSRDNLAISAYVTLPTGLSIDIAQQLPFVVLPHGGPHARDFLRFDWLVQLFASQGYGVLQMNFRGSTGYGAKFFEAGAKQWGQAMQDDITDGTHWLIEQGLADAERIAIVGASYGGYAALMGVAKEPDLYQCAISLNGVSDLNKLLADSEQYIGGKYSTRFIGNLWKDRNSLKANSPAKLPELIKAPVMLIHGTKDRVVRIAQSQKMQAALEKAGKAHRYIELPNGDHYLSNEANRLRFANEAVEFLGSYIGQATSESNLN